MSGVCCSQFKFKFNIKFVGADLRNAQEHRMQDLLINTIWYDYVHSKAERRIATVICRTEPTNKRVMKKVTTVTRAKSVLPNMHNAQAAEITPGSDGMVPSAGAWRYLQRTRSIPSPPGVMGVHSTFLSLVTLTFDLRIQTPSSEGPNTYSLWIWCKSVQRFPRYLRHKQKKEKVTDGAKNRTLLNECGKNRDMLRRNGPITIK